MELVRLGSTEVNLCDLQDNILYGLPDPGSVSQGKLTYILLDAFPCFYLFCLYLIIFFSCRQSRVAVSYFLPVEVTYFFTPITHLCFVVKDHKKALSLIKLIFICTI
jgi:hypothetical protein